MLWNRYKYIIGGLILVFLVSGLISFYLVYRPNPQTRPDLPMVIPMGEEMFKVEEETPVEVRKEFKVCREHSLVCELPPLDISLEERNKLNGLTLEDIEQFYPEKDWLIEVKNKSLILINLEVGLCPTHKKIWHLGENSTKDFVAVYYGPREVKEEGGIFRVTEIPIKNLPQDYQAKIRSHSIEFYQEDELIATLDTLSEFIH